jgi:hypothetical protein
MKTWIIKRYIVEEYSVEAESRKEALEKVYKKGDPYKICVIKETVKKEKCDK